MRDDALPLAHIAIAVEGASVSSPDIVPLMVANAIVGSYDLTYGGGKVGESLFSFFPLVVRTVTSHDLVEKKKIPFKLCPLGTLHVLSGHYGGVKHCLSKNLSQGSSLCLRTCREEHNC